MAINSTHVTDTVTLVGYQAVFQPSKYGHTLSTILPDELIEVLEKERDEKLQYIQGKLKNQRRATLKPEPWVEAESGGWAVKFVWKPDDHPSLPIVDSDGTAITDILPLYEGSKVKLAFIQKPYILQDGQTYGTSLKLKAIQVIEVCNGVGVDGVALDTASAAKLFGKTFFGFKSGDPNVRIIDVKEQPESPIDELDPTKEQLELPIDELDPTMDSTPLEDEDRINLNKRAQPEF